MSKTRSLENPLIPNKKLRELYTAMAEARVLDNHISALLDKKKAIKRIDSTQGHEACLVGTLLDIGQADFVSDSRKSPIVDYLLGTPLKTVLQPFTSNPTKAKPIENKSRAKRLPWTDDAEARWMIAVGAAFSLKACSETNLLVTYVDHNEAGGKAWRRLLALSGKHALPIIFIILPPLDKRSGKAAKQSKADRISTVPTIAVDADDAVALYRVMQESIGRSRGNGGPTVIDCIKYQLESKSAATGIDLDPIAQLQKFLLERGVANQTWLNRKTEAMREKLQASKN